MSEPSRQPRWHRQFLAQLAWIVVTVLAVVGVLYGTGIAGLCHLAENRSVRFYHRCDSMQYVPLTGLLVLIGGYVIAHFTGRPWVRAVAILGAFVPVLITIFGYGGD